MEEPIYGSADTLKSITNERFSGRMTIFLFIQVGFIIFERYLFLMNPPEWTDWETFKKPKAEYGDPRHVLIRRITRNLDYKTPKDKFVAIARRVNFLISVFNISADEFTDLVKNAHADDVNASDPEFKKKQDYIHNPLYKRLRYIQALMAFFYTAMFIYFPIMGNQTRYNQIFCNSDFQPVEHQKCNHVMENVYIHLFFVVTTLYFILCALQIRFGESFLKNQKKKDRKWTTTEKLTNTIVTKVPFVFEIKTALDFAVTNTSLGLFDWFKFEDIYNTFFAAKYAQISSDMKRLGAVRERVEKIIFGWVALIVFLAIVLAPIFIFSNFNPDSVSNTIQSIETTIGLQLGNSKFVLYSNSNPKSVEKISQDEFNDKIARYTKLLTFKSNVIQQVQLYPFGENSWSLSVEMYQQLDKLLLDSLGNQGTNTTLYSTVKMTQLNGKSWIYTIGATIKPQQVLVLHEMLTKCSNNKIVVENFYYQVRSSYP